VKGTIQSLASFFGQVRYDLPVPTMGHHEALHFGRILPYLQALNRLKGLAKYKHYSSFVFKRSDEEKMVL
jgi:hypothetical protein